MSACGGKLDKNPIGILFIFYTSDENETADAESVEFYNCMVYNKIVFLSY